MHLKNEATYPVLYNFNYLFSLIPFDASVLNFRIQNLYRVTLFSLDLNILRSMIVMVSRFRSSLGDTVDKREGLAF